MGTRERKAAYNSTFAITYLFRLTIITISIMFTLNCGNELKKEPEYISIITTIQKEDSTELNQRIERVKLSGREYSIVKVDTAFIRENISEFILPVINRAECVKEIHDLSNNDSSILVVEIKENHDIFKAKYEIDDLLKANKRNFPMNISDPIVIRGRKYKP